MSAASSTAWPLHPTQTHLFVLSSARSATSNPPACVARSFEGTATRLEMMKIRAILPSKEQCARAMKVPHVNEMRKKKPVSTHLYYQIMCLSERWVAGNCAE